MISIQQALQVVACCVAATEMWPKLHRRRQNCTGRGKLRWPVSITQPDDNTPASGQVAALRYLRSRWSYIFTLVFIYSLRLVMHSPGLAREPHCRFGETILS
jgi:hypothetical protein